MATLDDSPQLYLGQPWNVWADKLEGKHNDGEQNTLSAYLYLAHTPRCRITGDYTANVSDMISLMDALTI